MKLLTIRQEICTGCRECEVACSTAFFKTDNREYSAIRILNNDNTFIATMCNQCGECINMCIDKKKCVGCLGCVGYCSHLAMFYTDDLLEPFKCIACGICVKACPENALEIVGSEA